MNVNEKTLPLPVVRALKHLGSEVCNARRRRRIPVARMADRAHISRTTLVKLEKSDAGVSMGAYARVLSVLGFLGRLAELADVSSDTVGLGLDEERLPKRIRLPRNRDSA